MKNAVEMFGWPVLPLVLFLGVVTAQSPALPPDLSQAARKIDTWLRETKLSEHLELAKLRLVPHSSLFGNNDGDARSLRLDLRFRRADNEPDKAAKQFTDFVDEYQRANGVSLPDTLFYKLVHLCDWPRNDTLVSIIVLEDRFDIFLDLSSHELVFRQTKQRGPARQVITIPLLVNNTTAGPSHLTVKSTKTTDPNGLAQQIERFLKEHFIEANRAEHLKDPEFAYEPLEPDYVGMKVRGVKKQVLSSDKYWEKLAISVELKSVPEGQKVVCYVSGEYASGIFGKLPSDDDYTDIDEAKLRAFTGNLLRNLQDHISRSAP